ncbi:hypothetical protein NUSPORA_02627 [Nucleospora cyclopteri]
MACHLYNSISLRYNKQYLKIKQFFEAKIEKLLEFEITKVEHTRKTHFNNVNTKLLNHIKYILGNHVQIHRSKKSKRSLISKITSNCLMKKEKFHWKNNINKQIKNLEKFRNLVLCFEKLMSFYPSKELAK